MDTNRAMISATIDDYEVDNVSHAKIRVWNRGGFAGELTVLREDMYSVLDLLRGWVPIEDPFMKVICIQGMDENPKVVTTDDGMLAIEEFSSLITETVEECLVAELPDYVRLCINETVRDAELTDE